MFKFARRADLEAVKLLLSSKKASPFDVTRNGQSLLHVRSTTEQVSKRYTLLTMTAKIAAGTDCPDIVKLLLREGADPNARDNFGRFVESDSHIR